jgi:hypothetical protein
MVAVALTRNRDIRFGPQKSPEKGSDLGNPGRITFYFNYISAGMFRKIQLAFIFIFMLAGCDPRGCNIFWQPNFYGYISREDLIRIPLIQPYELLTLSNLDTDSIDYSDYNTVSWELRFKNPGKDHINTTDFNVVNGVIYGNGKRTRNAPNDCFVIIPARKLEKTFESETEWKAYLINLGIDPEKLLRPWPVFKKFEKDLVLPWYDPEKGIFPEKKKT